MAVDLMLRNLIGRDSNCVRIHNNLENGFVAHGRQAAMVAPLGERREQMKLAVSTAYVAVEIGEDELSTLTNEELAKLRISREELHRCFAEGVKLMKGRSDSDRVRPIAVETYDGKWEVHIVQSDPLMQDSDGIKH
jgi:hypothetical protein